MKCFTKVAVTLLLLVITTGGALAQTGTLEERADGTGKYTVDSGDSQGQWGIAVAKPQLWSELVKANPHIANPDLIVPGDTLNVPVNLMAEFQSYLDSIDPFMGSNPQVVAPPTAEPAPMVEQTTESYWWLVWPALMLLLGLFMASLWYRSRITNPYNGPPVREGGLPTPELAEQHAIQRYQEMRGNLPVNVSAVLPPTVSVVRTRAIDVRGPMLVQFAGGRTERRNLTQWTPAWQVFLSDGTSTITLMACANDVHSGTRTGTLPETQIRTRQDVPEHTTPRQAWPVQSTQTEEAPTGPTVTTPVNVANYTSVKVTGPKRYVLHGGGDREIVVDLGIIEGITLGIHGDEVYIEFGDQRQLIGRIVPESVKADAGVAPTTGGNVPAAPHETTPAS